MVEDWFGPWLANHLLLHSQAKLPEHDSEEATAVYAAWMAAFKARGLHDHDVASEASSRLLATKHYPKDHLAELIDLATLIYAERRAAQGGVIDSMAAARAASLECRDCGGSGFATRYLHHDAGPNRPRGVGMAYYCVCPAGRYVKRRHSEAPEPENRVRCEDLAQHPELQLRDVPWSNLPDNKFRHRPSHWDESTGAPIVGPLPVADYRVAARRLAEARAANRLKAPAPNIVARASGVPQDGRSWVGGMDSTFGSQSPHSGAPEPQYDDIAF